MPDELETFFYGIKLMSVEAIFEAQLYIAIAFLVFAWIPENYLGSSLGMMRAVTCFGALPVTILGKSGESESEIKLVVLILAGLLAIDWVLNIFFLVEHPFKKKLSIEESSVSNKIFLYQYSQADESRSRFQRGQQRRVYSNMSIIEIMKCQTTMLLTLSYAFKLFHDRLLYVNRYTFLNRTDHRISRNIFLFGGGAMALVAGLLSDLVFKKRRFTSIIAVNLIVLVVEVPMLIFSSFNPMVANNEMGQGIFFLIGALTDGYCYMYYLLGAIQIAHKAASCKNKSILGTTLGVIQGIGFIIQILVCDGLVKFVSDSEPLFYTSMFGALVISMGLLLPMSLDELKATRIFFSSPDEEDEPMEFGFEEDEQEEYEVDPFEKEKAKREESRSSTESDEDDSHE